MAIARYPCASPFVGKGRIVTDYSAARFMRWDCRPRSAFCCVHTGYMSILAPCLHAYKWLVRSACGLLASIGGHCRAICPLILARDSSFSPAYTRITVLNSRCGIPHHPHHGHGQARQPASNPRLGLQWFRPSARPASRSYLPFSVEVGHRDDRFTFLSCVISLFRRSRTRRGSIYLS